MSNSFHHTPNKARALLEAMSILSRPYQRRTDGYARPPSRRAEILTGAAAGFLPAVQLRRRWYLLQLRRAETQDGAAGHAARRSLGIFREKLCDGLSPAVFWLWALRSPLTWQPPRN